MAEVIKSRRTLLENRSWVLACIYFVGVLVMYAIVILSAKMPPPFVDYPDWVFQGMLFHGVVSGHPVAGYVLKQYPIPNATTTLGLGLLDMILPWQWAAKIWICFYLALAGAVSWVLVQTLGTREWTLMLALPGIIFLNLDFWYGHINFEIGMCLVILLLAMLIRQVHTSWVTAY